ncbi:hypothetical protein IMPR6_470006 [Imperialibacter sp. EC-SDR9]|nr:hypothetical protein IMPERIA75_190006 [Imperialibacter sp. 75]CAD5280874.1 hypothetical protein IMPERIA89_480006 [Imperialibacter sp. 89]VVT28814.1 hypothetical protein IMPR6_470006 [Imperialibacter sp. EC-SDR9]
MVARSLKSDLNHIVRDFKSFTSKEIIKQVKNEPGESREDRAGEPVDDRNISGVCQTI